MPSWLRGGNGYTLDEITNVLPTNQRGFRTITGFVV
jgi:hypothetical protein